MPPGSGPGLWDWSWPGGSRWSTTTSGAAAACWTAWARAKSLPRLTPCCRRSPCRSASPGRRRGRVLFLAPDKLAQDPRLLRNLLLLTAEKNLRLSRRIFHTSSKTIRGRVLSYLSFEAARNGSREFTIPLYPAAAGGLSGGGPQRPVPRAGQHGPGGPAAHPALSLRPAGTGRQRVKTSIPEDTRWDARFVLTWGPYSLE